MFIFFVNILYILCTKIRFKKYKVNRYFNHFLILDKKIINSKQDRRNIFINENRIRYCKLC